MGRIPLYPSLKHGYDFIGEFLERASTVGEGRRLQSVEFVENTVDGRVCNKVVDIVVLCGDLLSLVNER